MKEQIIEIVKRLSRDGLIPDDTESLFDGGYLDSFSLPGLVEELQVQFNVSIPDTDLTFHNFDSIGQIQKYLRARS